MSGVLVEVRDVPEDVHAVLKAPAAMAGVSLSEHLRGVLVRCAGSPTPQELSTRIRVHGAAFPGEPSELSVRQLRDE
jgi:plasmid stability protein